MSETVKVVQPVGILDDIRAGQLRREVGEVVASGANQVLIDLKDVTFVNSSGLSALVSALKTVRTSGGKLFLCSVNDQVKMLFQLTRMDQVFEVFENQADFTKKVITTK